MGSNYRLIVALNGSPPGLWTVAVQGQSGHPGSPHYCGQRTEGVAGWYLYLLLESTAKHAKRTLIASNV